MTQQGAKRLGVTIHEQGGWYLREPGMKNHKGKWLGQPSTQQEWIPLTWENWQEEGQPKAESEKVKSQEAEVSSLRTPRNGKSARDFQGDNTKRRKLWGIRKGPALWVTSTAQALVPRGAKEKNWWYPGTLEWHYKRGRQRTLKGHSAIVNHNRIIKKTLLKTQTK